MWVFFQVDGVHGVCGVNAPPNVVVENKRVNGCAMGQGQQNSVKVYTMRQFHVTPNHVQVSFLFFLVIDDQGYSRFSVIWQR